MSPINPQPAIVSSVPSLLPRAGWRTGTPDLFHRYLDSRMRSGGGVGNGSQFLFELGGHLDPADLQARLDEALAIAPVLGAGLERWPGRRWRHHPLHRVPLAVQEHDGSSSDAWFSRWFGEPFAPIGAPSLELVLRHRADGTDVLIRWLHALTDAPGMDLLCRLLDGEDPARFRLRDDEGALVRRLRSGWPWWRRALDVHNLALRHVGRSLVPPFQPRIDRAARQSVLLHTLSPEQTTALWARAAALTGGLDRNAYLLAVTARACVQAWRPARWQSLRIPVPISLRPPAWRGPVLSNWFSMVLVQVPVRRLRTLEEATETIRAAWRRALARYEDRATMALMAPAAWLPSPLVRLLVEGPRLRDGATLNSSFVTLGAGRDGHWLGRPLRRAVIASSILAPPGLGAVFSESVGRLSVAIPGREGEAADALRDALVSLLHGREA